jgi:hypothetical protein
MLSNKLCALIALGAASAIGLTACSGDGNGDLPPTGPTAGTFAVTLTTPNADDGAIVFRVTGPGITQVTSAVASYYIHYDQTGTSLTVVIVGDLEDGALLTFRVPDVSAVSSYGATALEVADRANELRGSVGSYGLNVAPASS